MTELEKDLLANGFSENDLKKLRRARERAKQDEQVEGDNALDYDDTLREEIKVLGSTFLCITYAILVILILFNTSRISEEYSTLEMMTLSFIITVFVYLCSSIANPLMLGLKSCLYKKRFKNNK
ncbi:MULTISPECIES: hypothetical protein [Erwinia]|uniref:Uncharacterized protein n=1 Tax=Erwinia rhapontici TaxID=55212 RepID=A0ABM7MW55_ERWRD|nr:MULTISPECIES: hypothetical protein [Erwinia]MBP2154186.1 hypothetical protein [Erwinia rhapontici]NNS06711.1 hypothetical protein [Erwinia sp. JH02]BCQ33458.1 hypothetical protein ERHA53_08010 [Erwinia rhapontici]BCQ43373.1 hypothetical protein ERHA55_09000 [Erwinia rhapontici]